MRSGDSVCLTEVKGFKIEEFRVRWAAARIHCLRFILNKTSIACRDIKTEDELLSLIPVEQRDDILRAIFDASRALAVSASKYFRVRFEMSDFILLLGDVGIPCLAGCWQAKNNAFVLSRKGCEGIRRQEPGSGSLYCDYWREAFDGLVMGLGESERFTRHSSCGHGDEVCLDILYSEADEKTNRFAEIPFEIANKLAGIQERFVKRGINLTFEGLSEGTLFFRMVAHGKAVCGPGGRLFEEDLVKEVGTIFPGVALQDVSPLAVYGEKA